MTLKKTAGNRVPLHVNIVGIFFLMLTVLLGAVVFYNYERNSKAALTAGDAMLALVGDRVSERVASLLFPVEALVETAVTVPALTDPGFDLSGSAGDYLRRVLDVHPSVTSVYIGLGEGEFHQLYRFAGPEDRQAIALKAPADARYAIRRNFADTGFEQFFFRNADDRTVDVRARNDSEYDHRRRTWYTKAVGVDAAVRTSLYAFSATGEIGLTFARKFPQAAGLSGVIGADITMQSLSGFLNSQKLTGEDRLVLFDASGRVLAVSDGEAVAATTEGKVRPLRITELEAPAVQVIMDEVFDFSERQELRFSVDGAAYLGLITPVLADSHEPLYLAMAVPATAFTGPIEETRQQSLLVSLGVLLLAFPLVLIASRAISRPLTALAKEAERIGELDLTDDIRNRSRIQEIWTLTGAMNQARSALRTFAPYIPKSLVEQLMAAGRGAEIGGDRREVAVMFTDVESFSEIAEETAPEALTRRMSAYFDLFQREIGATDGVIDKYIGDSVMALWNAPRRIDDAAARSCAAALRCQERVRAFNAQLEAEGLRPFKTRIGLNLGEALVGNVGSMERMNYTAYGSTVVVASRLEALNKHYGSWVLVAETLRDRIADRYLMRSIDLVMPKGSSHSERIYELIGAFDAADGPVASEEQKAICKRWEEAFDLMQSRDFAGAVKRFEQLTQSHPTDGPARLMLARCRDYVANPPSADWDGVVKFSEKF